MGLIIFQLAMAGFLASQQAFVRSSLVVPLIVAGLVSMYRWEENWGRLSRFIALRAVKEPVRVGDEAGEGTPDERRERGLAFINPNLVTPLEKPWIVRSRGGDGEGGDNRGSDLMRSDIMRRDHGGRDNGGRDIRRSENGSVGLENPWAVSDGVEDGF